MQLPNLFANTVAAVLVLQPSFVTAALSKCVTIDASWRVHIVSSWLKVWAGDLSLANKTVTPTIHIYQDRFPTGNTSEPFPVASKAEFLNFVEISRQGFTKYGFNNDLMFGHENMLVFRWTLNATFAGGQGASLKAGSQVAYNGTDILILDKCTGLINEVLSAQDLITYFHVLGQPVGVV